MTSKEMKRYLARLGATFETHKGGSGHLTVHLNGGTTQLPMHGSERQLPKGTIHRIKKDLGLL